MANECVDGITPPTMPASLARVLCAAAHGFVGNSGESGRNRGGATIEARLEIVVGSLAPDLRWQLLWGGRFLQVIALVRCGRPFTGLPIARARRLLAALECSRVAKIRRLHRILKMLTQYAWFLGEETWEACGYDGPWIGRLDIEVRPGPEIEAGLE